MIDFSIKIQTESRLYAMVYIMQKDYNNSSSSNK